MAARLDAAAAGEKIYGPTLTEQEARDRLADAVSGAKFKKFMQTRLAGGRFCWTVDEAAVEKAELFDGKLAVVTNVDDLSAAGAISRYKELADIERGFRVLKSEIEIAPVFHWLPERIRAHAMICFLALVLHRVMRMRLKAAGVAASPETVLETLAEIQRHRIFIDKRKHEGNTAQTPVQEHFFDALKVSKPA